MPGETIKRVAFAARLKVNRSTVTRWAESGRLVLDPAGDVLVEESLARLRETSAGRDDVAARHATNRGAAIPEAAAGGENAPAAEKREPGHAMEGETAPQRDGGAETKASAAARKESALADIAEMEAEEKRRSRVKIEVYDATNKAIGTSVRVRLDAIPDGYTPMFAPYLAKNEYLVEVHAILSEIARTSQSDIADDMHRAKSALGSK